MEKDVVNINKKENKLVVEACTGYKGLHSKKEKVVIDFLGLSDPLLARLPANPRARIGHYGRAIPKGYIQSILTNKNKIKNPNIAKFYEKIKIITQSKDLFSKERINTIVNMNLGKYDYLIEDIKCIYDKKPCNKIKYFEDPIIGKTYKNIKTKI